MLKSLFNWATIYFCVSVLYAFLNSKFLPYGYEFINHSEKPAQVMLPRKIDKAYAYIAYKGKCKALASRRKQGIQPLLCFAQKMRHQYGWWDISMVWFSRNLRGAEKLIHVWYDDNFFTVFERTYHSFFSINYIITETLEFVYNYCICL